MLRRATVPMLSPYITALGIDCMPHQDTLASGTLQNTADNSIEFILLTSLKPLFRYGAVVVKHVNCWRTHTAPSHVVWQRLDSGTVQHASTMPARLIPGRWGTNCECEAKRRAALRCVMLALLKMVSASGCMQLLARPCRAQTTLPGSRSLPCHPRKFNVVATAPTRIIWCDGVLIQCVALRHRSFGW